MQFLICWGIIILVLGMIGSVNAAMDHKSFEKCWSKVIPQGEFHIRDAMEATGMKPIMEYNIMIGNFSASNLGDKFAVDIHDCMLGVK